MKKLLAIALVMVLALSMLTACGSKSSPLVGKWELQEGSIWSGTEMEIKEDGTWVIGTSNWSWRESDDIIYGSSADGKPTQSYYYSISGSELTLTNTYSGDGRTAVYKRVK